LTCILAQQLKDYRMTFTLKRTMLAACSVAILAATSPALAGPAKHRSTGVATSLHRLSLDEFSSSRRMRRGVRLTRHSRRGSRRGMARIQPADSGGAPTGEANASSSSLPGFGASYVVAEARRYIGTNPTGRGSLWCARFMNLVLERTGHHGTGSDMARSFASYGQRVAGPQVGAIAVMSRHGGGHVGVVSALDPAGNPVIVSGNHGGRVAEAVYPRGRIYAYVMPQS
jgi:uncharacterized protein (TIGR02594 family)